MKKAQDTIAMKGNPVTKPPTGGSSNQTPAQATFSALDICSEWQPTSVPDSPAVKNPEEEVFLKELEEKFGSKEEAERLFSRFSAFRQQPQTIPEESTAQPPKSHSEIPQTLDPAKPRHRKTGKMWWRN